MREGRRAEFAKFPEFLDPHKREKIPDPTSEETFQSAKLNWAEAKEGCHAKWYAFYRELLQIRHRGIIPRLEGIEGGSGSYEILGEGAVSVRWKMGDGSLLCLIANLGNVRIADISHSGRRLWPTEIHSGNPLDTWGVIWSLADAPEGGRRV